MTQLTIEAAGGRARFVAADLRDPAGATRLAEQAGEVDILVNNAGSSWFGASADLGADGFDVLFDGNVRSAYVLTAALAPKMAARGSGSIVNIGSMAGAVGVAGGAPYSATKASMNALTRAWAAEFSPAGVRVNTVAPGPVRTSGAKTEVIDGLATTTLLGRAAQPEEIADVITFLSGPGRPTSPAPPSRSTAAGPLSDHPYSGTMASAAGSGRRSARERRLEAADRLFYTEGVGKVGIDRVLEESGVAKGSLYYNFGGKDDLVRAYLQNRHAKWAARLNERMAAEATPRAKILVIFDALGTLFTEPDFRGCAFHNAVAMDADPDAAGSAREAAQALLDSASPA